MSRTKAVGITAVIAILIVIAVALAFALSQGMLSKKKNALSEPLFFDNTRYEATMPTSEGLSGKDETVNDVEIVVRFFDEGETATITSPTLSTYSELEWQEDYTYKVVTQKEDVDDTDPLMPEEDLPTIEFTPIGPGEIEIEIHSPSGGDSNSSEGTETDWEITEGEEGLAERGPAAEASDDSANTNADAGTVCGEVVAEWSGNDLAVVALTDGTDCEAALEVFADYLSKEPSGLAPQGSGGFWDAPNGWGCSRGYVFPGEEDFGSNMHPTCSDPDGTSQATAVDPGRVHEMEF